MGIETTQHANIDLKEACVQAAHEVIAEKGIEHLSLRDVARKLGVSHQAPYRHYPSKDHLLAEVISRCFREFVVFLDARKHASDPESDLEALGQQYIAYAMNHPLEYRLMFGTPWPDAAADSQLIQDALHSFNVLRNVLVRIHGTSKAARANIDLDSMFIWSTMHGLVTIAQCNAMKNLELEPKVEGNVSKHVLSMISAAMKSRFVK
jgi:AcrR family transcriptional regulator